MRNNRRSGWRAVLTGCAIGYVLTACHQPKAVETDRTAGDTALTEAERIGKLLFFDENLSEPAGQSCATCHTPEKGFADRDSRVISEGAGPGLFSARNAMTIAYSAFVPPLCYDEAEQTYVGGLFWDGRINTLEEQAAEPFVNRVEMGLPHRQHLTDRVRRAEYYARLTACYGAADEADSLHCRIVSALAAYERSSEVNPFSSKFDAWLDGRCRLTEAEQRGYDLFREKAMCAECHVLDPDERAGRILLTDHTYDNLGIPANPDSPFFSLPAEWNPAGRDSVDLGLGAVTGDPEQNGKFRVPTLRNIGLTAPYGHNGYFPTLESIVRFYNVRDVSDEFPAPEYPATVNRDELGNLGLTPEEEADLVAFLLTLDDGYRPPETETNSPK